MPPTSTCELHWGQGRCDVPLLHATGCRRGWQLSSLPRRVPPCRHVLAFEQLAPKELGRVAVRYRLVSTAAPYVRSSCTCGCCTAPSSTAQLRPPLQPGCVTLLSLPAVLTSACHNLSHGSMAGRGHALVSAPCRWNASPSTA